MKKTYILHHNDADGFGAAYAAMQKFGRGKNVHYISVDYGQEMPVLDDGSHLYILDFSYRRDVLDSLVKRMETVMVIDHHKSAMLDLLDHPNAIFDMNKSGAGLAWDYFNPEKPRPDFINYIEESDLFRFTLPDSRLIRNSIYQVPLDLGAYKKAAKVSMATRVKEGKIIQKVYDMNLKMGLDVMHVIEVDEFRMLAINVCLHMSDYGNLLCKEHIAEHNCDFAGVYYRYTQDAFKFSCRSIGEFDVSTLCRRFGGGGHKNASGFEISVDRFNGNRITSKV